MFLPKSATLIIIKDFYNPNVNYTSSMQSFKTIPRQFNIIYAIEGVIKIYIQSVQL